MEPEPGEDVLIVGPNRPTRSARRTAVGAVVAGLVVAGLLVVQSGRTHGTGRSAGRSTAANRTSGATATSASATPSAVVDDEYLVQVPAGDMRAALASAACRSGCVAHNLVGADLDHAAAGFAGLRALAGGFVTAHASSVVQESIEGRARPDALVHLVIEPTAAAATRSVETRNHVGDGFRSVLLTTVRDGWRFTAALVVRGAVPPLRAAAAWARSAPVPG